MIRVLIVDDIETFRERFRDVLEQDPSIRVVGAASSGEEAVHLALKERPDVILMDVIMEDDRAGITSAMRITEALSSVKIIMSTVLEDDETVYNAFQIGAVDYLLKNARPEEVLTAVKAAYNDQSTPSPFVAKKLRREFKTLRGYQDTIKLALNIIRELTQVELDVLLLLCDGKSRGDIAHLRCIELSTVKTHIGNILRKLAMKNSHDVVALLKKNQALDLLKQSLRQ
jgi:NarL family two-component system response regulator LiaR